MADAAPTGPRRPLLGRITESRNGLGLLFMLPAAAFLLCFLTYPLGLGVWLGFTDTTIGRAGIFVGLENYRWLADDSVFWLAVFNTLLYTTVASVLKFGLGLWLALILNEKLPMKSFFRAIVLLPWVVPTVLSALAFWWIFDSQFSIISWVLMQWGLIDAPINFLGEPWNARWSVIAANVWRGVPFVAISLLAGLQTIPQSLNEAAALDGATSWQRFRWVTLPLLTPIIAVVMTFSVLFTFTDFQLIYVLTRGGPVNATHLMATLVVPARDPRRPARRGRGDRGGDDPVPARRDPVQLLRAATPQMAAGWGRLMAKSEPETEIVVDALAAARAATATTDDIVGMEQFNSLPRRILVVYLPLAMFVFVLLFPFYWMAITAVKPDHQLTNYTEYSPFWVVGPTLDHIKYLFLETSYPGWLWNTMIVSVASTVLALAASVLGAYAIERVRFTGARITGLLIFLAYLVPPSILFIPLAFIVFKVGIFDLRLALILTYPTFLIPFCTWLLMGYFRTIPYELEESALVDGASRWQILTKIILPLAVPGLISAGIFAFTLSWNEFIYALTFISSSENKTVPVGVLTELVRGDIYEWGALMSGALVGSLPVVILYSFFVDYYVSSMTGAVKE